jgi:methyl-accepting chemotaxis protein
MAQSTESVGNRMNEMELRTQEIGSIVETIQDIADRTNLLALNAAIEAARAGDHGRGFAVVADEVRKLAEQSSKSARQITNLVKAVQKSAQDAAAAMTQSQRQVNQGLTNAARTDAVFSQIDQTVQQVYQEITLLLNAIGDMRNSSEGLAEMMEQLTGAVQENATAVTQIRINSQDVFGSIENLHVSAQANSSASVEMSAAAEEVSAQVEETVASAESLAQMAEQLRSLVSQFTVEGNLEIEAVAEVDPALENADDGDEPEPEPHASDQPLAQPAENTRQKEAHLSLNGRH